MRSALVLALLLMSCRQPSSPAPEPSAAGPATTGPLAPDAAVALPPPSTSAPAQPDETACSEPTDCAVVPGECCECQGYGGKKPRAVASAFYARAGAACAHTRCEPCPTGFEAGPDPNFVAVCESGKCRALDVRTLPASECKADADCSLTPPRCCGCSGEPVAVSRTASESLRVALCGNAQCAACGIPAYTGLGAACERGHCVRRGKWQREAPGL